MLWLKHDGWKQRVHDGDEHLIRQPWRWWHTQQNDCACFDSTRGSRNSMCVRTSGEGADSPHALFTALYRQPLTLSAHCLCTHRLPSASVK